MDETFAKIRVESMIEKYGDISQIYRSLNKYDVFILSNGSTIKLPADNSRIPEREVKMISEIKLEISEWEYDYWKGEQ